MYSSPVDAESAHVRDTAYGIRSNEETKASIKVGKKGASVDNVQFSEDLELRGEPKNFPKGQIPKRKKVTFFVPARAT